MSSGSVESSRFAHLDGLRSVAILWVVLYHYSYFWTSAGRGDDILPYDDALSWIPLASVGGFGVNLFFIISGFVITLSLERSQSLMHFASARMWRLLPTLVLCGTLTFIATAILGPVNLKRDFLEYSISLMFLPPEHVGRILGVAGLEWLDGAYWSLWTEVRFYAIIGVIFFLLRDRAYMFWSVFALISAVLHYTFVLSGSRTLDAITGLIFSNSQPYFTAGIALYLLSFGRHTRLATVMLAGSFVHAMLIVSLPPLWHGNLSSQASHVLAVMFAVAIVFAISIATVFRTPVAQPLSARVPALVGRASYPYYLLHQNFGIALLIGFGPTAVGSSIAVMIAVQLAIVLLSVLIYQRFERGFVASTRRRLSGKLRPSAS